MALPRLLDAKVTFWPALIALGPLFELASVYCAHICPETDWPALRLGIPGIITFTGMLTGTSCPFDSPPSSMTSFDAVKRLFRFCVDAPEGMNIIFAEAQLAPDAWPTVTSKFPELILSIG